VWPIQFDSARFHVHFAGPNSEAMNQGKSLRDTFTSLFEIPVTNLAFHDVRKASYGISAPYVLLPAIAFLLPLLCLFVLLSFVVPRVQLFRRARVAFWCVGPCFGVLLVSPALWWARFNLPLFPGVMVLIAWAAGRKRQAFAEAIGGWHDPREHSSIHVELSDLGNLLFKGLELRSNDAVATRNERHRHGLGSNS
jgi:hypothetical protein